MKYALITGAAGGLGGAVTRAMADEGWKVFAADINVAALEKYNNEPNIIPLLMDITSMDSLQKAFNEVSKTTDKLDAILNISGMHTMASLIEGDITNMMEKILSINVMGMIRVNKVFFPMILKGKGRIINFSSECGWMTPQPFNGPYTITKYAVEAYNDSLRRELMYLDIPVVKIQPGSFKTNMHNDAKAGFDKMINATDFYKRTLKIMKPLMLIELKFANDPQVLVDAVLDAVDSENPKIRYKVKNSKLLGILEFIPEKAIDVIYKALLK